jgi:hypothetical protein
MRRLKLEVKAKNLVSKEDIPIQPATPSSHLRLPTILARPQRSPIISSRLSIRSLSLQANRIPQHSRVGLELLLGPLLKSLSTAACFVIV